MSTNSTKKQDLTEKQRLDLARFVEKLQTMIPSDYQTAIFEKARTQAGCYVINAGPGSGKTTTSIKASTYFTGKRALFLAFNNKIQRDTEMKLKAIKSKASASTLHSFGLSCLMAYKRGKCVVDAKKEKYFLIVKSLLKEHWDAFLFTLGTLDPDGEQPSWIEAQSWAEKLIHYVQVSLSETGPDDLLALVEQFDLNEINPSSLIWPLVTLIVRIALAEGLRLFEQSRVVTFDDMLYYPNIISDVPVHTYDHIILDEAQDASRAGLALLLRACTAHTQIFAVGDIKQSINAFAGTDQDSIPRIIDQLHAETLPLRVCYRCGTSIIDLANQLDGQIIPAPGAKPGSVEVLSKDTYLTMLQAGDAVIARTTAALVEDCLKVLQSGRRAMVLGRDLGRSIAAIVTRMEEMRAPALRQGLSNFAELLLLHQQHKQREIIESEKLKNKDIAIEEFNDRIETVKAFSIAYFACCQDRNLLTTNDPQVQYNRTAEDLKAYIKGIFTDDEENALILFMTAHRSKGGEWPRVFITETGKFPHPKAKSPRQQVQESNLMYIAITRAQDELYFVDAPFECLTISGHDPRTEVPQHEEHKEPEHDDTPHESDAYEAPSWDVAPNWDTIPFENFTHEDTQDEAPINQAKPTEDRYNIIYSADGTTFVAGSLGSLDALNLAESAEDEYTITHNADGTVFASATGSPDPLDALYLEELNAWDDKQDRLDPPDNEQEKDSEQEEESWFVESTIEEMPPFQQQNIPAAKICKALAIEILCPACGSACVDPATGSFMITEDLTGHTVICSSPNCRKACLVPLNAFSLVGDMTAREKPLFQKPNNQIEKKGRTQRERKSHTGRKAKGDAPRQPLQLSLDMRLIKTLNVMGINKSELFEELLNQYEPFLQAYQELRSREFFNSQSQDEPKGDD